VRGRQQRGLLPRQLQRVRGGSQATARSRRRHAASHSLPQAQRVNALVAIAAVAGVLALFFLSRTVSCTRRGRLLKASGAGIGTAASAALATAAVLLAISYLSYERLTAEQVVA